MELIYGGKSEDEDGPTPDDILDRDLATPHFVSWSALREMKNLHHIIHALPEYEHLRQMADECLTCMGHLDDHISKGP